MKPIYKIIIIVAALIIAGIAVYLSWQKFTATPPTLPETGGGVSLPGAGPAATPGGGAGGEFGTSPTSTAPGTSSLSSSLKKISESPAFGLWVAEGTKEVYYLSPEGKVFSVKEGPDLEISAQSLSALNRMIPAPGGGRVLAAFGDPRVPRWNYFDVVDGSWHSLPANIENATWGGTSDQLVVLMKNGGETNLALFSLTQTTQNTRVLIRDVSLEDILMWFESPEQIIIAERPSASYASRVWRLDLKTLSFSLILAPERGLSIVPMRGNNVVLKWSTADQLFVLNHTFERGEKTPFSTFPEKCDVSAETLYCFTPRNAFPQNITIPDGYYQNKFYTTDSLVRIPIASTTPFLGVADSPWASTAASPIDAKNPRVVGGVLYFINRYDGFVYKLTIGT